MHTYTQQPVSGSVELDLTAGDTSVAALGGDTSVPGSLMPGDVAATAPVTPERAVSGATRDLGRVGGAAAAVEAVAEEKALVSLAAPGAEGGGGEGAEEVAVEAAVAGGGVAAMTVVDEEHQAEEGMVSGGQDDSMGGPATPKAVQVSPRVGVHDLALGSCSGSR